MIRTTLVMLLLFCAMNGAIGQSARGLIAHYKFNNGYADDSGNRNNGSQMGSLSFVEDRFGNQCSALAFNGNGFVQVASSPSLNSPTNELTIAAWVMADVGGVNTPALMWFSVCAKGNSASETATVPQYRLQMTSRTISLNTEFTENIDQYIMPGIWYHCALVYTGYQALLYLNGEEVFNFPYSNTLLPNNEPLEIGRDVPGNLENHVGAIDDLRIYKRALDASSIMALYEDATEQSGTGVNCAGKTTIPPVIIAKTDTVYKPTTVVIAKTDTVYRPNTVVIAKTDTVYRPNTVVIAKTDTVYRPNTVVVTKTDTVYKSSTVVIQKPEPYKGTIDFSKPSFKLEKVYFEQSQPKLLPESKEELDDLLNALNAFPNVHIRLEGHTDNVGDAGKNLTLSARRVEVVKNYLVNRGIAEGRIAVEAFGQTRPLNDNSTEDLRKANRRVEVKVTKR